MKIAFVYDVLYPETIGGVEKRIYEIGTRLALRGHEVHLFPMSIEGRGTIFRDGLIIHQVCRPVGLYSGGRRSVFQALWYTFHLFPVLLRVRVDVIDCQNFPYFPVFISRVIGYLKKERCIITWHECWGQYWYQYLGKAGLMGRIIEKLTLVLSGTSIAVSRHTAIRMKEEGYEKEINIVPNGITLSEINQIRPDGKSSDIIFIGRFIPDKHPEMVVEAVRILTREYPDLSCIMIGDGPMMSHTKSLINHHNLSKNIQLAGFITDYRKVLGILKAARVFVLPSEREGFGIVCIEAMASGLPIITTRYPLNAASDHILSGCGYCAEASPTDIARGIKTYLSQEPDYECMQTYVREHDWDIISRSLEAFYQSAICNK